MIQRALQATWFSRQKRELMRRCIEAERLWLDDFSELLVQVVEAVLSCTLLHPMAVLDTTQPIESPHLTELSKFGQQYLDILH